MKMMTSGRIVAALVAGGLFALGSAEARAETSPPQTPGIAIPDGQIDKAIARIDGLATDILARSGIPGLAIAVVKDGKTVYAKGFGVRKVGEPALVDADTVFQIASLSKSLSAGVVAHEVGTGGISWDTPLVEYLPWFRLQDPWVSQHVTIADMFSHRSGLPDHAGDDLEDLGYDRRAVLERLSLLPLDGFRNVYAYTNFGLTAAAEAVAQASGKSWEDLAEAVLFKPLGMNSTSARFADFEKRPNRALGHVPVGDAYQAKYQRQPDDQTPAGGISSSANDLARWLSMMLQEGRFEGAEIIPRRALLPAMTAQVVSAPSFAVDARPGLYGYGIGVGVSPSGRMMLTHSGAFSMGAATYYSIIPSVGIGIVVLTNAAPTGAAEAIGTSFTDLVQFGEVTRDWYAAYNPYMLKFSAPAGSLVGKEPPADPKPAAPLSVYTGTYGNAYFGDLTIAAEGDGLVLTIGPAGKRYPLTHFDGDTFAFHPSSENQTDGSLAAIRFDRQPDDTETQLLTIDYLDANGWGRFKRS